MKLGLRSKIYLSIFFLLLLCGTVIFSVVSWIVKGALLEANRKRGLTVATNLAARIAEPMLADDFLRMKTLVDETVQLDDDIYYAFVLDRHGEPLAHTFRGGFPVQLKHANSVSAPYRFHIRLLDSGKLLIYDYAVPVRIGSDRLGTVRIGLLRTKIQQALNRLLLSTSLATGFVVIVAAFVGTALALPVTRRIKVLQMSTEQVLRGNLDVRTAPLLKKNCWQIMNCKNEACPAFGNRAHRCWYLAGTLCPRCVEGAYARKIESCVQCPVYRQCAGDELQSLAESFDSMTLALGDRLAELKKTQQWLEEQKQLLRTILDATPDFVFLQDLDSVYLAANKAFCRFMKRDEEDIVGKSDFDLFTPAMAERFHTEDREIIHSGKTLIKENRIRRNGDTRWLYIMKVPVYDAGGQVSGLLCSGRDITEFKRVQQQLVQSQKMETIGQLTAGIAHEINTPLGIILGYAQLLLDDVDEGSQFQADLKIIEKQTKVCRRIVSDLLAFSRHTDSRARSLDLNRSIEAVVAVMEHPLGLERVVLKRDYADDLPPVHGDVEKLKQVFVNLLNNARDAIAADGCIRIVTRFDPRDRHLVVYIADTGDGIPAQRMDKIFDPFFTTKPVDKGTGLGLAVTFGIIQEHGGSIEVESPPSDAVRQVCGAEARGTVFIIRLPAASVTTKGESGDGKNYRAG